MTIHTKQPEVLEKRKRREAILKMVESKKYKKQADIVEELKRQNFTTVQATVSRDIKDMNIKKDEDGTYKITDETLHEIHVNELQSLLEENPFTYFNNVAYHYLNVEKGKASLFALHLQQAFPEVILDVTITVDSLVILVNNDADTKDFFALVQNL